MAGICNYLCLFV